MKKIVLLFLLAISLTLSGAPAGAQQLPAAAPTPGPAQPRLLVLEGAIFDAGDIEPGSTVTHVFKFKNEGNAPLQFTEIRAGCSCMIADDYDKVIQPGAVGQITIAIRVYKEWAGHALRRATWVSTNDPLTPNLRLVMSGNVLPRGQKTSKKKTGTSAGD